MHLTAAEVKQLRSTIALFVSTSVMRHHPERSWAIVHPVARQGLTKRQWSTGNIPIVPFPAAGVDLFTLQSAADRTVLAELLLEPSRKSNLVQDVPDRAAPGAAGSPRLAHLRLGARGRVRESDPAGRPLGAGRRLARAASLRRLARRARRGALRRLGPDSDGSGRPRDVPVPPCERRLSPFALRRERLGKNGRTSRSRSRSRSARSTASPS